MAFWMTERTRDMRSKVMHRTAGINRAQYPNEPKEQPMKEPAMTGFYGEAQTMIEPTMVKDRPAAAPVKPTPLIDCDTMDESSIAEYREVAATIGLKPIDLLIEEFKLFLANRDIPTFNIAEVRSYMDGITARDNPSKLGWHWRPVREKDRFQASFGVGSVEDHGESLSARYSMQQNATPYQFIPTRRPSSDHYNPASPVYTRAIPLHALKKIALVEKEFGAGKVNFLVTEYTTEPHVVITPDPFLMAVIPNAELHAGKGRFIIDVWDEPGFGIARMVK